MAAGSQQYPKVPKNVLKPCLANDVCKGPVLSTLQSVFQDKILLEDLGVKQADSWWFSVLAPELSHIKQQL